jgi:hypothetical protein
MPQQPTTAFVLVLGAIIAPYPRFLIADRNYPYSEKFRQNNETPFSRVHLNNFVNITAALSNQLFS